MRPLEDTIVAISTAAGSAARAIVRLSGPDALPLAEAIFAADQVELAEVGGFRWVDGLVRLAGERIELPARAYVFRGPRSYTRQDVVELHVPGPAALACGLSWALADAGARPAEPGEFTARAFFSGRIDLSQAQAVADVIHAMDAASLRAASAVLGGRVHRLTDAANRSLLEWVATVEASIDLADEGIELEPPDQVARGLKELASRLRTLSQQAADVADTASVPRVVLTGRPNAGKSSLLNVLAGVDRAIVSAIAGTTRDVLSIPMPLPDGPGVLLQDAAGLASWGDDLNRAADAASRAALGAADVVLFVVDACDLCEPRDLALLREVRAASGGSILRLLLNKCDLAPTAAASPAMEAELDSPALPTSALTGEGLHQVRRMLVDVLGVPPGHSGQALGLHQRQKRALLAAAEAMERAADLLASAGEIADVAELAAIELHAAMGQLGLISGELATEDVLASIFSRFCVGK